MQTSCSLTSLRCSLQHRDPSVPQTGHEQRLLRYTWGLSRLVAGTGDSSRASLGTDASAKAKSSCATPRRSCALLLSLTCTSAPLSSCSQLTSQLEHSMLASAAQRRGQLAGSTLRLLKLPFGSLVWL